jgi:uncharacterized protein (DUF2236 family)
VPSGNVSSLSPRRLVRSSLDALFDAPDPLEHTMRWCGDPGICGPESVSWKVIGDVSAFVGGVRALLIQSTHPEVVAGVQQHSRYREDPLGRLGRTANYVVATTFGAMPEVEHAVAMVTRAHSRVNGVSDRGVPYAASDPALAAWVHNSLTSSFLTAYQRFRAPLERREADLFVQEQARIGELLGASPLPLTAEDLDHWLRTHPSLGDSDGMREAVRFLKNPPLSLHVKPFYRVVFEGAVCTVPETLRDVLDLDADDRSFRRARVLLSGLRCVLGPAGPAKLAAMRRCGERI